MDKNKLLNDIKKNVAQWVIEFRKNFWLIFLSLMLLVLSGVIDFCSGSYVSSIPVRDVSDIILSHIGPYNLGFIFVYGFLLIVFVMFAYPLIFKINKLHIVLSQYSFLVILRSIFMAMTHLKTPIDAIPVHFPQFLSFLRFQNDLFFSGHVAIPFLGFLIFKDKCIRYFFLISSIVMAITVLLTHQHYSIDVFAAFFITYSSFRLVNYFLRKTRKWRKSQ